MSTTIAPRAIAESAPYVLIYRAAGKRPNTTRWARKRVASVAAAVAWMNETPTAFRPARVVSNDWKQDVAAILG